MKKILQKYTPEAPNKKMDKREFMLHKLSCVVHLVLWIGGIVWILSNNNSFSDLSVIDYLVVVAIVLIKPDVTYFRDIIMSYDKYLKRYEEMGGKALF